MSDDHRDLDPQQPANIPGETGVESASAEAVETFIPDPPEAVERAEQMIRQAHFAKQKGQSAVADKLLKEAQEVAPHSPVVLEAIGDDYVARGQFRKAKEVYARAHKIDPSIASIENKFGEMVLRVDLHLDPVTYADSETMASAKAAVILSLLFPGVGQMVLGKWTLGITMFAIWGGCLTLLVLLPGGLSAMFQSLTRPADVDPLAFVLAPSMCFAWLWSIFDANVRAKQATPRSIERPTPPIEGGFLDR